MRLELRARISLTLRIVFAAITFAGADIPIAEGQTSTIILVQHSTRDAGISTSSSLQFSTSNAAGNFIAVAIRAGVSGQTFSVTDTKGNTYRQAVKIDVTVDAPSGDTLAIFYAENIIGGANTVTVSDTISAATLRFAILEYSGVARASSLEGASAAQGTNGSPASGTVTTTTGGDLLFGAVMSGNGQTFTAGGRYYNSDLVRCARHKADHGRTCSIYGRCGVGYGSIKQSDSVGSSSRGFPARDVVPVLSRSHPYKDACRYFTPGQSGATYTLTVTNVGTGPTSGP